MTINIPKQREPQMLESAFKSKTHRLIDHTAMAPAPQSDKSQASIQIFSQRENPSSNCGLMCNNQYSSSAATTD